MARAFSAGLPTLLLTVSALAQPAPTTTAVSGATPFTGSASGFEAIQIPTFAYNPAWAPWRFQLLSQTQLPGGAAIIHGSGIAKNGSGILAASVPAPEGSGVAFLHGTGQAGLAYAFGLGTWRLRFLAAQRVQGTTPDTQVIRVVVDGHTVFEGAPGATFTEFATEPFTITSTSPRPVVFQGLQGANGGEMALLDRMLLDPVRPWSDPNTWSHGQPDANDDVLIPPQVPVVMDGDCVAATVRVEGLLTADVTDGSLTTRWVMVTGADGHLQIGTAARPHTGDFQITLIGSDTTENVMGAGTKFLMAMNGGQIDLHGLAKTPWSRLTSLQPAPQGGATIAVTDTDGWQVGDRVVVAYTGWMDHTAPASWSTRSRTGTITAVGPAAGTLTIDTSLAAADHCTAAPTSWPTNPAPGQRTWKLDQRAEVGNLSRNIRIVGDVSASPGFGGHVMVMGMPNGMHGRARIANVRMFQLGQAGRLGRYPMHWHMQHDNGAGQYFRSCAVERSFNRAITIHGTNYAEAADNVCFDQMGHAVFFEDGVEQHNEVHRNLVIFTRRPAAGAELLLTDNQLDQVQNRTPAVFWISHPNNHLTGNVAAESVGTGYWIIPHTQATGTSAGAEWTHLFGGIDGTQAPLGTFANNVAHSCKSAFDVNDTLRDRPLGQAPFGTPTDPRDDFIWTNRSWDPPHQEVIEGFIAWGCPIGIYAGLGSGNTFTDRVRFRDCVLADNGGHVQLACSFIVEDSLLVHDSGNGIFGQQTAHDFQQGFAQIVYDGPAQMYRCHLVGYDSASGHSVLYDGFGAARRHTNHVLKNLTFETGGDPRIDFADYWPGIGSSQVWGIVVRDVDGSLSRGAYPGYSLVTNHPMMRVIDTAGASRDRPASGINGWFSPYRWAHLQVFHFSASNNLLSAAQLPPTRFDRLPYGTTVAADFDDSASVMAEIRQCPVIVAPGGAAVPAFEYRIALDEGPSPAPAVRRIDLVIDDAIAGDVTLLEATFDNDPNWAPTVRLDGNTTPLAPGGTDPAITSYTLANGVLRLRVVSPARLHRVQLNW